MTGKEIAFVDVALTDENWSRKDMKAQMLNAPSIQSKPKEECK